VRNDVDHGAAAMSTGGIRWRARRRGQSLVEFALVTPIVILLLVGLLDLGRGVFAYNSLANAARAGARIATVNQIEVSPDCENDRPVVDPADPHWSIKACAVAAANALGISQSAVTVAYSAPAGSSLQCPGAGSVLAVGCIAEVTVEHRYEPLTPLVGNIVGPLDLRATSQMAIERVFP
jgi:Flp pilus assembly protein TadG